MPNLPTVSILMSVYNGAATISEALTSLARQTWQTFEIVIINDASTDNSLDIIKRHLAHFSPKQLRIFTNSKNLGLTKSLNIGLAHARGQLIARLDADDMWSPTKLEKQVNFLIANPNIGVVGCWYTNCLHFGCRTVRLPVTSKEIDRLIFRHNPFGHSCVVIRKSILVAAGGYNESLRFGQDRDLWFRLWLKTRFYNLPKVLVTRTVSPKYSHTNKTDQIAQSIRTGLHYRRIYHAPLVSYFWLLEQLLAYIYHYVRR